MKIKRLICLTLILALTLSSNAFANDTLIISPKPEPTEKESYISGYPDGTFAPDANVTRAEALAILFRVVEDKNKDLPLKSTFSDVNAGDWYYKYVAYFDSNEYLEDYGDTFEPNKAITRKEFVYLLTEINTPFQYYQREFTDVDKEDPYYMPICKAAAAGYVGGYPDGSFRPDGNITRAETVTVMNRYLKRNYIAQGPVSFTDISNHWAKQQIIVSANERVYTDENGEIITVWEEKEPEYTFEIPKGNTFIDNVDHLVENCTDMCVDEYVNAVDAVIDAKIAEIIGSTTSEVDVTGKIFYVSNNGDDKNDGLSPETAWKSLTKVNSTPFGSDSAVLFERGGLWRGQLRTQSNTTYSAYGEGERPRIYGSAKNYGGKSNWEATQDPKIFKLRNKINNVGIIAYDHVNGLGNVHELVSQPVSSLANLKSDLQFYCDKVTNEVYVYSEEGNPGIRFKNIEIGAYGNIIAAAGANVVIDNLTVMYGGSHGVGYGTTTNLTVQNCIFAWIGGSWLSDTTRYGNAIEIYGGATGYTVTGNYCYQMYDTGITLQYGSTGKCIQRDVLIQDNIVEYCCWGIEFYNSGYSETDERLCKDFDVSYNAVRYTGYGWGRPGVADAYQSCGMTPNTENFKVYRNIFHTSLNSLLSLREGGDELIEFSDNIYIHQLGKLFGYYRSRRVQASYLTFDQLEDPGVYDQENPILIYTFIIPPTKL